MLPDTHLIVGDIQGPGSLENLPPDFVGKCNKIFSSATLHWCSRDPRAVLINVHKILEVGGLFVAEMGGDGNIASTNYIIFLIFQRQLNADIGVRDALHAALRKRGIDPVARDPWFFPTADQYMGLLRSANLDPLQASLYPRSTPFADLSEWVRLFGKQFLQGMDPEDEQELVDEVVSRCRESGVCYWDDEKKSWYLDYVRLRIIAVKAEGRGNF
jgi:SAM-dependent methyltransferase